MSRFAVSAAFINCFTPATSAHAAGSEEAAESADQAAQSANIIVTGERVEPPSTATKLPLTLKETPQSVTVVTRQRIEDFNLNSVLDVVGQTPGVTIQRWDSNRANFNVRGFPVRNLQLDGVPTIYQVGPYENSAVGDIAIYDRVEIIRGVAGLFAGVGDPSATVNLVRKRAPNEFQGYYRMEAGSFSGYRFEGDVGGPLNQDGSVRARLVGAYTDRESFIDFLRDRIPVLYGTLEWDVSPRTRLRVGADYLRTNSTGAGWGNVPLYYSDGTKTDLPRSFTGAARWAQWLREGTTMFASAEQDVGKDWLLRFSYNRKRGSNESKLFNVPNGFPNRDGTGLAAPWSFFGAVDQQEDSFDGYASGKFKLFGREHEAVFGINYFDRNFVVDRSAFGAPPEDYPTTQSPTIDPWDPNFAPPPVIRSDVRNFAQDVRQWGGYGVVRLNPADWLKMTAGVRYTDYLSQRSDYDAEDRRLPDGPSNRQSERKWAPYGGVVVDLNKAVSLYASYATIFSPVSARNAANEILPPTNGTNYEAGIKATPFGNDFTISAAGFHIKQDNITITDPNGIPNSLPGNMTPSLSVSGVKTWGGELELAGEISPGWTVNGSYTYAKSKDRDGLRVNPVFPLHLARLYTTYRMMEDRLTLGGGISAQSRIFDRGGIPNGSFTPEGAPVLEGGVVEQKGFVLVDLLARYKVTPRATLSLNISNLFDKKYYSSVLYSFGGPGGYYGDPRRIIGGVRVDF